MKYDYISLKTITALAHHLLFFSRFVLCRNLHYIALVAKPDRFHKIREQSAEELFHEYRFWLFTFVNEELYHVSLEF